MAAQVLQGSPASVDLLRVGQVVFRPAAAGGAATLVVPDTAVTANSVIVVSGVGAVDATAITFSVNVITAGASFTIKTEAAASADKLVNYAVLKY